MVVAPLARLAVRDLAALRHVVPAVRPVVDGVQQQPLVRRVLAQVRRAEQRPRHRQPGLEQVAALALRLALLEQSAEPQQALRRDRRRRRVDGLEVVLGVGRPVAVARELCEPGRARVPVRHAVGRRHLQVVVRHHARGLQHVGLDLGPASERLELRVFQRLQELELLREAQQHPGLPARPRREGRVALLRRRAAEAAVDHVEDALVRHAAGLVPGVAAAAPVDGEARGRARVLQQPLEQRGGTVALLEQRLAQPVRQRERAQRAHGVGEERVRAVEGVDVAPAVLRASPAPRLHRAARLERQLAELALASLGLVAALEHQPSQRAPGADVVEAVVVDAHVRDVRRHARVGALAPELEERALAGRVELQQRRAELEALGPVGPAARRVAPALREDRRAVGRAPALLEIEDLPRGQLPEAGEARLEVGRPQPMVGADHRARPRSVSAHLAWPS